MKPIKNIILYSNKLPPKYIGGIETNALYLAKMLYKSSRYNVFIVTQGKSGIFNKYQFLEKNNNKLKARLISKKNLRKFNLVSKMLLLSKFSVDETLIYHNTLDLHRFFKPLNALGYRQVARSGGNDIFYHQKNTDMDGQQFLENLNFLDCLILNSEYSLKRSVDVGLDKSKLKVIKGGCKKGNVSGLEVSAISKGRSPVILTCGRLVDFKGLEDAIEALNQVRNRGLDFKYYIIGDGELRGQLEIRIKEHQLESHCFFLGKQPPENISQFYLNADIYLSSSKDILRVSENYSYIHTETMGRSVCEAQVHGVPVVSTDAGGTPEMLIDKYTGLIASQGNVDELADAISYLLSNPDVLALYSEQAQVFASEEFSWQKVFDDTCKVFKSLDGRN